MRCVLCGFSEDTKKKTVKLKKKKYSLDAVCEDCSNLLDENPSQVLWETGSKCQSCGLPFGLVLMSRTISEPVKVTYSNKDYTVCKTCKRVIEDEKKNKVGRIMNEINRTLKHYERMAKDAGELKKKIEAEAKTLKERRHDFAVYHLKRGSYK